MQSTAMLEIRQAMNNGATFKDETAALAAVNGVLPDNSVLMHGKNIGASGEDAVYWSFRASPRWPVRSARSARRPELPDRAAGSEFLSDG